MHDSDCALECPIFFVGMPRSGTSIIFAGFAAHQDLSWFSQVMDRFPSLPALATLGRVTSLIPTTRQTVSRHTDVQSGLARLKLGPSEGYAIWSRCCDEKFLFEYLLDIRASPAERHCVRQRVHTTMRCHGKKRFAAKLTGPGRIGFLSSIFARPLFINIVRDPRAVVDSLLRVPFWRDTFRYSDPAWKGGLSAEDIADWKRSGTPEALASVQWRAVLRTTREEARAVGDRYIELRYEDFIARPHDELGRLYAFAGLPPDPAASAFVDQRLGLRDLTSEWRRRLSASQLETIEAIAMPISIGLGYEPSLP